MPVKKKTSKKSAAKKRDKFLVIVESPAKSKTINKILGRKYKVIASMGHIIDLPVSKMGIDFEDDFTPEYTVMKGRKKYLTAILKESKKSKSVFLAADPDREGEAICWHLKNRLEKSGAEIFRVSFDEITKRAVEEAFKTPRQIDMKLVNAQQARRILDRIVGYSLSPLLWKKVTRGLSAGRVQSVAVRLIVERENEIKAFTAQEYWSVDAILSKKDPREEEHPSFQARLVKHKGEKVHITDKESVDKIVAELEKEKFIVGDIKRKEKKSYPRSPYTTSVLQQDAFNKLYFSASKTMRTAQTLYEGVELGEEGSVGLITYMRTDSVRISDDARSDVRKFILDEYGEKYCPEKPPTYKSKKLAQEAHEAIRPTLPLRSPESVASYLPPDEYKLYKLVWKRFVASQMTSALYSVLTVNIDAGEYLFRAGGGHLLFDGFLKVYGGDSQQYKEISDMPPLETGEGLDPLEITPAQHFTKPPPRYTDASLVKILEEKGIGRPSTYAPILRTIIQRHYIKRIDRTLRPTELGDIVNKLIVDNFSEIVDYEFTAKMENELDDIEEGKLDRSSVLGSFYASFSKMVEEAKANMGTTKAYVGETDEICDKCGKDMVVKWGRRGRFLSCSNFPTCRNSKSITTGVGCPSETCDGELIERRSSRGAFYGCTKYPDCTYTSKKLPSDTDRDTEDGEIEEGQD